MITTHKIDEDFYDEEFLLLALHSDLEDFSLVYILNKNLNTRLHHTKEDLILEKHITFPVFEWKDELNDRHWTLIMNNSNVKQEMEMQDLFSSEPTFTSHYLVPECKEVDFFLKLESEDMGFLKSVLHELLQLPQIITAYAVDVHALKSKHNLIYE
jgi:hypothetical protein